MHAGGQLQPVQHRHADVGHHDVGVQFPDLFQRFAAVAGGAGQFIAQRGPVQHAAHADEHQRLVVHKKDADHVSSPFCSGSPGSRTSTVVPCPGVERMLRP